MFKSLLVIIFVALALWAVRSLMLRRQNKPVSQVSANKDMLQCIQCKTYIPREDAIIKDEQSFCSAQHLEDWKHSS